MKCAGKRIEEHKRVFKWNAGEISLEKPMVNVRHEQSNLGVSTPPVVEPSFIDRTRGYCLSELLPYDLSKKTGAGLKTALKEYEMLLVAASEAVETLKQGDLKKIDALVGENACEIRAAWLSIIVANNLIDTPMLLAEFCSKRQRISSLLQEQMLASLMMSGISLMELLEKESTSIYLSMEEMFIVQSFLLTETKELLPQQNGTVSLCIRERSSPKQLKRFGDISSSFADNLLSRLRKLIAAASVQFVRQIAAKAKNAHLIGMLSDDFTLLHNNHLLCTPMFWTYKSVLSALHYEGIPLIVYAEFIEKDTDGYRVIDSDWLFFEPSFNADGLPIFVQKQPKVTDHSKIAWVVQGAVLSDQNKPISKQQWKKTMLAFPVSTVILASAADHRQYPNADHDDKIQLLQDHEYEFHKAFAQSNGFALDNPRTFFIRHVHSSRVGVICDLKSKAKKTDFVFT